MEATIAETLCLHLVAHLQHVKDVQVIKCTTVKEEVKIIKTICQTKIKLLHKEKLLQS